LENKSNDTYEAQELKQKAEKVKNSGKTGEEGRI